MATFLTPVLFMNAQSSAGTYGTFYTDYRCENDKIRSISGSRADTGDIITVLTEIVVPQFGNDGSPATSVVVTATATVFTSAAGTYFSCQLEAPFTRVKVQKIGAGGVATVVGLI